MTRNTHFHRRGFVLLVALGVLGVLGLLAATFATLSRVERAVSASYVDRVRARLLAQSGVERAVASLRGRTMIQAWDDPRNDWYYRELLNAETATLVYSPAAKAIWKYVPNRPFGMPPRSLEAALDDGLVCGAPNGVSFPEPLSASANEPFSGQFPGSYEPRGDIYALKVVDCASQINVNDGHKQAVRILDNLGSLLKCSDGTPVSAGGFLLGTQIRAAAVARKRPFNNKAELLEDAFLRNAFFSSASEARKRFDAVRDFVTCHGWVDGTTTRFQDTWTGSTDYRTGGYSSAIAAAPAVDEASPPGVVAARPADSAVDPSDAPAETPAAPLFSIAPFLPGTYASLPSTTYLPALAPPFARDIRKGGRFRQYVLGAGDSADPDLRGETAPGKFGGTFCFAEPRTPVNVNTATKEVLVATLMDLEADFWDYAVLDEGAAPREFTSLLALINVKISRLDAEAIADALISGRMTHGEPAGSWSYNDWMHFENDVLDILPGMTRYQKALVKANANPNSNVRKLCPDLILVTSNPATDPDELVRLDKSDVKTGSTEWTFSSNGIYEIESIGRIYSGGRIMAEERIETVVKVFDQVVFSTQEQFEDDRLWTADDSSEGDLDAGGYPPVISMPEYAYNPETAAAHYRGRLGDVSWCADYEGYLVLNGPAKVRAGVGPGPAYVPATKTTGLANMADGCYGPAPGVVPDWHVPPLRTPTFVPKTPCGVSFVAGFNSASVYPAQSHRNAWHDALPDFSGLTGGPRHPEFVGSSRNCHNDSSSTCSPLISHASDAKYYSGSLWNRTLATQIRPDAGPAGQGSGGANFWDNGCDLQNFGIYLNPLRRNRFHTYWADEVPSPDCTIEMTVKPEIDLWNWARRSKMHTYSSPWTVGSIPVWPCSRQFLFDWSPGAAHRSNYTVRGYVQLGRVFLEFVHEKTGKTYAMCADHSWKPHTWHHVEFSWVRGGPTQVGSATVDVPPNAMLFVDGRPATAIVSGVFPGPADVNARVGADVYPALAMALPEMVHPYLPHSDWFTGPRFSVGSCLAGSGTTGMTQPAWHGIIDNIVMHHWRSHAATFSPRNRYHSTTYYDGTAFRSGKGYKGERAGLYKKRLRFLEDLAKVAPLTIGTVGCTHYHPFHVHLYGHDGAAPTTAFGHITPALRIKNGASWVDEWAYDGCVGVPVRAQIPAGAELHYLAWFEVASLVPVTMSPILCDIRITYFEEPLTLYRAAGAEARR
jgi:hypothetical protein